MKKDIILFLGIFLILSVITGGTYAYFQWVSGDDGGVVFNTPGDIERYIYYDAGESHFVGNFQPSSNFCGGQSSTVSFYIKDGTSYNEVEHGKLYVMLKMDVNQIDPKIAQSSAVKWAVTQGSATDCTSSTLASGSFNGKTSGDSFDLLDNIKILKQSVCKNDENISSDCQYTVWVWIDQNTTADLNLLSGKTIDLNIWSQIDVGFDDDYDDGWYSSDGRFVSWDNLVDNGYIILAGDDLIHDSTNQLSSGKLVVPDSITMIYMHGLNSSKITEVVIPKSVTIIGRYAFPDSLTHIYYEGTKEEWSAIDIQGENPAITNAIIHYNYSADSVESVDDIEFAKYGLYDEDGIFTPWDTLVSDGDITLSGSSITGSNGSLTGILNISNVITDISTDTFNNSSLKKVIIPDSIEYLGIGIFSYSSLTSVVLPDSLTSLNTGIFAYSQLINVKLPNQLKTIPSWGFGGSTLKTIIIPKTVTKIESNAFVGTQLTDVYYEGTEEEWNDITIGSNNDPLINATIHYNYKG